MNPYLLKLFKLFFSTTGHILPSFSTRVAEKLFTTVPYSKRRENEQELLDGAVRFTIDMDSGHQLAAYRWGRQSDPIVLFVHGWTATATCFSRFIENLVLQGYQVVSYDSIAHGESSGRATSLPEWADSVHAVNKTIGPVHCIIGHSLGSAALVIGSSIGFDTQKLVLLSPATNVNDILSRFAELISLPEKVRIKLSSFLWQKYGHIAAKYGRDWEDVFVSEFRVPTLIIHDKNDKEVDIENARWLARRWSGAKFIETERLGHRRILLSQKVISLVGEFIETPQAEHQS